MVHTCGLQGPSGVVCTPVLELAVSAASGLMGKGHVMSRFNGFLNRKVVV